MEFDAPETHKISWNSVPVCKVVCAFPYILAFTPVAIEFRYAVNGSLLQTLAMPELRLISAKVSIYMYQCNQNLVSMSFETLNGSMELDLLSFLLRLKYEILIAKLLLCRGNIIAEVYQTR